MRHVIAAVAVTLLVAGCAGLRPPAGQSSTGLSADQALYAAEAAFAIASAGLDQASASGGLNPGSAARERLIYENAHQALQDARAARAAGDVAGATAHASDAIAASARLDELERAAMPAKGSGQ